MSDLNSCLSRATEALVARRNRAGYWEGRLASSPLGTAVSLCALDEGDISEVQRRNAYAYLAKSMRGFYSRTEYEGVLREAGFSSVSGADLTFGVASIVSGEVAC